MIWLSGLMAMLSLLTVFKAPAKPLWYLAVAATEWGHWLAVLSAALALAGWFFSRRWGMASWLALGAAVLYLTPCYRAMGVARTLPDQLAASFGTFFPRENSHAPFRAKPLDLADLFKGIPTPSVRETSVVYASLQQQSLWLDLYRPADAEEFLPLVLIVHGGSWQGGDRKDFPELDRYLAARGYFVASMDYRLAPRSIFPAQRDDVFSAIAYLKAHAAELGLDKDRLVLLGRSAGGQIALSAAYNGKDAAIKGVIAFYTPNDLAWAYSIPANPLIMNSQKVIETYLGGSPEQISGAYEAASPLRFVDKNTPPTLMIHGTRDELVWAQHDIRLSQRLAEAHRPYCYLRLPWATHGFDANFSGPGGQLSTYAVERFLAAVMPASQSSLSRIRRQ